MIHLTQLMMAGAGTNKMNNKISKMWAIKRGITVDSGQQIT